MFTAEVKDYILSAIQNRLKNKIIEWPNNVQIFPSWVKKYRGLEAEDQIDEILLERKINKNFKSSKNWSIELF